MESASKVDDIDEDVHLLLQCLLACCLFSSGGSAALGVCQALLQRLCLLFQRLAAQKGTKRRIWI